MAAAGADVGRLEQEPEPDRKRPRVDDMGGNWTDDEGETDGESGAFEC